MISRCDIQVVADAETLARTVVERAVAIGLEAIARRGKAYIALSGGSTPKRMAEILATPEYQGRIPWDDVVFFWGDERWVPLESPDSNAGEVIRIFLSKVDIPPINVQPVVTTGEPDAAAADYEQTILRMVPGGKPPRFDLVMLGMGDDGHTASLFPHTSAVHEKERLVVANRVEQLDTTRITFTPPLINAAREVIFLVSGAGKAERLREVLQGPQDIDRLPSQVVQPTHGSLHWIIDEDAASLLNR